MAHTKETKLSPERAARDEANSKVYFLLQRMNWFAAGSHPARSLAQFMFALGQARIIEQAEVEAKEVAAARRVGGGKRKHGKRGTSKRKKKRGVVGVEEGPFHPWQLGSLDPDYYHASQVYHSRNVHKPTGNYFQCEASPGWWCNHDSCRPIYSEDEYGDYASEACAEQDGDY
jgi:hypothetical protein